MTVRSEALPLSLSLLSNSARGPEPDDTKVMWTDSKETDGAGVRGGDGGRGPTQVRGSMVDANEKT